MTEKCPCLIDTIVSNGHKAFDLRNGLLSNLKESIVLFVIMSHISTL